MYLHIIIDPAGGQLRFSCIASPAAFPDPVASAARVIVVFTTEAETVDSLRLAETLATDKTGIWMVCPVSRSPLGWLRLARFTRFLRRRVRLLSESTRMRLRIIACPDAGQGDPLEELLGARSLLIVRTRWWRPWGRATADATTFCARKATLIL